MAVRNFDGAGEMITCSQGGVTGDLTAADLSILVLLKPTDIDVSGRPSITAGIVGSVNAFGFYDNGTGIIAMGGDAGDAFSGGGIFTAGDWQVIGMTRASGASPTPRFHRKILGTGSWTHSNATGVFPMVATSPTAIRFGKWPTAAGDYYGRLGVAAVWKGTLLSDANYETIETAHSTAAILALSPTACWEFNQTSVGTNVTDLVGSAHQTALTGTTAVTGDDPTWTFGAGGSPPILYWTRRKARRGRRFTTLAK